MALVKCKECGNEISSSATACPKCGAPTSSGKLANFVSSFSKIGFGSFLLLFLLGMFLFDYLFPEKEEVRKISSQQTHNPLPTLDPPPIKAANPNIPFEKEICLAAIERLFSRGTLSKYVGSYEEDGRTIYIFSSPKEPSNTDACFVDGDQVIWRVETAPGINRGRWRNHPMDEKITFKVDEKTIWITLSYPDGSGKPEKFSLKQLSAAIH